jgi:hypothetical protein
VRGWDSRQRGMSMTAIADTLEFVGPRRGLSASLRPVATGCDR